MATTATERMRAHRARRRRRVRRLTIEVSEDDLKSLVEHGYEGAGNGADEDRRSHAVSLFISDTVACLGRIG
jgi:hypothetical protein